MLSESERKDVDWKTAHLLVVKGREMPAYLATLNMADRLVCVQAIHKIWPFPNEIFTALLAYPEHFASHMTEDTCQKFDQLAENVKDVIAGWTAEDLLEDVSALTAKMTKRNRQAQQQMDSRRKAAYN